MDLRLGYFGLAQFAAPVYGCGYPGDNSAWVSRVQMLGPDKSTLWLRRWDPSHYLPRARMPILWVNGTNDFAYPMDSWKKSYQLPKSPRTLCLRVPMPHGHGPAGEEIHIFANSILKQGKKLPALIDQGQSDNEAWATFQSDLTIRSSELAWTRDTGRWQDRKWEQSAARIDPDRKRVSATIPPDAKVST